MTDTTETHDWVIPPLKHRAEIKQWGEHARSDLIEVAEAGRVVTYQHLYERLLVRTGRECAPLMWRNWIAYVLGEVARLNKAYEEPLLTSLVVLAATDEVNPDGYAYAIEMRYGTRPDYPAMHAQDERGKCHRFFASPLL